MLHSYGGSADFAKSLLKLGGGLGARIYFSFSARINLRPPATKLAAVLAAVPLDRLLLESDDSDPAGGGGEGGDEGSRDRAGREAARHAGALAQGALAQGALLALAQRIAGAKGVSVGEVVRATRGNAERFFGLSTRAGHGGA